MPHNNPSVPRVRATLRDSGARRPLRREIALTATWMRRLGSGAATRRARPIQPGGGR